MADGGSSDSGRNNLISRLLRCVPDGTIANVIRDSAGKSQVPEAIPLAIYALETGFRPWWVRIFEGGYLCLAVAWWLCTGVGFRNVTVGPFQVGCHLVAEYMGIAYSRTNGNWRPAVRSLRLAGALLRLPFFGFNLEVAMHRIRDLWAAAVEGRSTPMTAASEVGRRYNGTVWYGESLKILFVRLSRAPSRSPKDSP